MTDPTMIFCECGCVKGEPYPDGTVPLFTADENFARKEFLNFLLHKYFGVHLNGKHVLAVKYNGGWYGGLSPNTFWGSTR